MNNNNNNPTGAISHLSAGLRNVSLSENNSTNSINNNNNNNNLSNVSGIRNDINMSDSNNLNTVNQNNNQNNTVNSNNNNNNNNNNNSNNNNMNINNRFNGSRKSISGSYSRQSNLDHYSVKNQFEQETNQTLNEDSVSRLKEFFNNGPYNEGYTLISHRSAPNGFKVAIILSELDLPYSTILLDFNKGEQRAPEFLTINPNGRVPALIDHSNRDQNVSIWESGAIILYLVEKKLKEFGSCSIWSDNLVEQSQILSWLFFQTSGHAPMIGQALHFRYFHSINVPSAIDRYTDEVRRVYGVVEMALAEKREAVIMEMDAENASSYSAGLTPLSQSRYFDYPVWLVGDRCTIADLCFVTWNYVVDRIGIDLKSEFPEVFKWTKHIMRRPGVLRALKGNE
ncbi:hypothetical protein B5S32_g5059 [[Candida] boidinii]|nr:hypothetical protein B5S32_g5059 [[Candida] boidinii]